MSWFDALSSGFARLIPTKRTRIISRLTALNPFVQNGDMIDSVVSDRLANAENRINAAINEKLRNRGVRDVQWRVRDKMQSQINDYVDAVIDGTPGLDLPGLDIGLNPFVIARIQARILVFEQSVLLNVRRKFVPEKDFVEYAISQGINEVDSMIDAAINRKLSSRNASLEMRRILEEKVDAMLEPTVDRIVAAIQATPDINLPI